MRTAIVITAFVLLAAACSAAPWGVAAGFADQPEAQSRYEAGVLAAQGVTGVFLNMRGTRSNWPNWVAVQKAWNSAGVSCFWDLPTTLSECERILGFPPETFPFDDRITLEDGSRGYFTGASKLGNYFSAEFVFQTQRLAKAMARRLQTPAGYQVTANVDLAGGSYDPEALASWRAFLKRFFKDDSPADDTDRDTATFNSAFTANYSTWDSVPLFGSKELGDPRKRVLRDLWLASSYADYVQGVCSSLNSVSRAAVSGPGAAGLASSGVDASVLAARPAVSAIYTDSMDALPALDCAAAAFGKKLIADSIQLVPGDYEASYQRALKLLPYAASGAFFVYETLVRERTDTEPAEIVRFDPAFQVLPVLSQFVGKLRVERAPVLWIVGQGADATGVVNAHCVTEAALALDPKCLDLTRYGVVIYRSARPSISLAILQELFEYALKGGTVLLDGCRIAGGPTIDGRDNAHFWWEGMKLARGAYGEGRTEVAYAGRTWRFDSTMPYLTGDSKKVESVGTVRDSSGASYPLLLVRKIGQSGRWVFVNVPGSDSQPSLLRAIAKDQAGVDLPDPSAPLLYTGEGCVLAICGDSATSVAVNCSFEEAVVTDVFTQASITLRPKDGKLALPGELKPHQARLWTVRAAPAP